MASRKTSSKHTSHKPAHKKHKTPDRARKAPFDVKLIGFVLLLLSITAAAHITGVFETDDFVEADVLEVNGNTIVLGHGCRAIVAETTTDQARSIRLGLEDRIDVRPTTHDVFVAALNAYNITVEEAALTRFEDNIYFGEIVLRREDRVLRLDSRPTDAIATALRVDAPIMINKTVLESQGQDVC